MTYGEVGLGLGRNESGDRTERHQRRHAICGAPAISVSEQQRAGTGGERADVLAHLRNGRHDRLLVDRTAAMRQPSIAPFCEKRAEYWRAIFVEEGSPDEFELMSNGELAHHSDRLNRNLGLPQPGGLRYLHKKTRNTLAEAEPQHSCITPVG